MPSFRPNSDNNIVKHYAWSRTRLTSTSSFCPPFSSSTRDHEQSTSEKSSARYEKKDCHICGNVINKNQTQKRCSCNSLCHKNCYEKTNK